MGFFSYLLDKRVDEGAHLVGSGAIGLAVAEIGGDGGCQVNKLHGVARSIIHRPGASADEACGRRPVIRYGSGCHQLADTYLFRRQLAFARALFRIDRGTGVGRAYRRDSAQASRGGAIGQQNERVSDTHSAYLLWARHTLSAQSVRVEPAVEGNVGVIRGG